MTRKLCKRKFVISVISKDSYGYTVIISLWWYGLAFIVSQNWKNRHLQAGES